MSTVLNNFEDIQLTKSKEIADACAGILLEKIAGEWEKKFKKPSYDKRFFDDLITDCRRIKGIDNSAIKSSPVYKFAVAYSVFYKHGLTVKFHTIEFSMDKDSVKQYLLKGFVFKNQSDDNTKTIDFKKTEVSSKEKTINFPTEISIKPWDRPGVWLQRKISGFKTELGTDSWDFNIHTGNGSYSFLWKNPGMYITIHYGVRGYIFPKLLNECFGTEKPDKDAILGKDE